MTYQLPRHPLEIALEQRNNEIRLFWQRSNYFLVLNSALFVAFVANSSWLLSGFLATFGVITSILWFFTNLGSKFWQERWEIAVSECERRLNSPEQYHFSEDQKTIKDKVEIRLVVSDLNRIQSAIEDKKRYYLGIRFDRLFRRLILCKPSVSKLMIMLSATFFFAWIVLMFTAPLFIAESEPSVTTSISIG